MITLKKTALTTALLAMVASAPALAYQKGDFIARAGWAKVVPSSDESDPFKGSALRGTNSKVKVSNADSLGLTFAYMLTDNVGVGLLGAYPFKHDIKGKSGALRGAGKLLDTKQLPPTLTLQWHFNPGYHLHPYIGAGVNYTYFFDQNTKGALKGTSMDLNNSWGLAGEAGMDYTFWNDYLVSAQVWYIDIDTKAKSSSSAIGDATVDIDPWVFMLGVGKKF